MPCCYWELNVQCAREVNHKFRNYVFFDQVFPVQTSLREGVEENQVTVLNTINTKTTIAINDPVASENAFICLVKPVNVRTFPRGHASTLSLNFRD